MPSVRIDLVFSYWIFAWFLLYEFHVTDYNPKMWLILGVIENAVMLLFMIYYKNSAWFILLFIFINTWIKLVPLWILRSTQFTSSDFMAGLILFAVYLCWVYINYGSFKNVWRQIKSSVSKIQHAEPSTPLIQYLFKGLEGRGGRVEA